MHPIPSQVENYKRKTKQFSLSFENHSREKFAQETIRKKQFTLKGELILFLIWFKIGFCRKNEFAFDIGFFDPFSAFNMNLPFLNIFIVPNFPTGSCPIKIKKSKRLRKNSEIRRNSVVRNLSTAPALSYNHSNTITNFSHFILVFLMKFANFE